MLFNSIQFMIFFPAVCLIYFLIPQKVKYLFLLLCSYFFYMCWNPQYALLMFTSTLITYLSGLFIEHSEMVCSGSAKEKRKKLYVGLSFTGNLAILFFFKYYNFTAATVVRLLTLFHIQVTPPAFDVILPVGISFYTFQALSYTMDVYRKEIRAEHNLLKYALFVSFFPQLVAGPIERSKNLLSQISEKHVFQWGRVKNALLLMLYGYFQKVVLAEYLGTIVDNVYNTWETCSGFQLMVATVCFALQIYCDFDSYSNIAIGAAKVMGFRLMDNFNTPYFSQSVAEFWRRWHISLSTWFRDYLYIPLGGNRRGTVRKYVNLMIVFLVSGLWHGAEWHFVIWGGLNGFYQIIGQVMKPVKEYAVSFFRIDKSVDSHKLLRMLITFVLVDISWIFFRARSVKESIHILINILNIRSENWFAFNGNLTKFGLSRATLTVLLISVLVLLFTDLCRYKGIVVRQWILKQGIWLQWALLYAFIFGILIFGIYGPQYDASQFIYFQF